MFSRKPALIKICIWLFVKHSNPVSAHRMPKDSFFTWKENCFSCRGRFAQGNTDREIFIKDSYATRKDKGSHRAIYRAKSERRENAGMDTKTYLFKRVSRIFPSLLRVRRQNLQRSLNRLWLRKRQWEKGAVVEKEFLQSYASIIGHLEKIQTYHLRLKYFV